MKSRMCDLLQHYGHRTWLICWRQIAHFQIPAPWRSYELSFRDRCVLPADSEDVSGVFTGTLKRALALSMARQWPVLKGRLRFCCATILRSCSRGCWHTCWSTGILRWLWSYWKILTSILLHLNRLMLEKKCLCLKFQLHCCWIQLVPFACFANIAWQLNCFRFQLQNLIHSSCKLPMDNVFTWSK